jgi:hypothetical protein
MKRSIKKTRTEPQYDKKDMKARIGQQGLDDRTLKQGQYSKDESKDRKARTERKVRKEGQ